MIYNGTYKQETMIVSPNNDEKEIQFIDLVIDPNEQILSVRLDADTEDYYWDFYLDNPSDYERIKFNIMQSAWDVEDMEELAKTLDRIFSDGFADILIGDEE